MITALPNVKNVLAVFAHPDDEAFGPGGTLALLAQKGEVTLVCVTDGGNENRIRELKDSAEIIGISEVVLLGYPDGSLNNAIYHQVADDIRKIADRVKPDILLTFEPRGISGHLDHIAVSMICSFVFRGCKKIKQIWYFGELERKFERPFHNKYFIYFPEGYKKQEMDAVISTKTVYQTQVAAMRAHQSQKKDGERLIMARRLLPKVEYFLVTKR